MLFHFVLSTSCVILPFRECLPLKYVLVLEIGQLKMQNIDNDSDITEYHMIWGILWTCLARSLVYSPDPVYSQVIRKEIDGYKYHILVLHMMTLWPSSYQILGLIRKRVSVSHTLSKYKPLNSRIYVLWHQGSFIKLLKCQNTQKMLKGIE